MRSSAIRPGARSRGRAPGPWQRLLLRRASAGISRGGESFRLLGVGMGRDAFRSGHGDALEGPLDVPVPRVQPLSQSKLLFPAIDVAHLASGQAELLVQLRFDSAVTADFDCSSELADRFRPVV